MSKGQKIPSRYLMDDDSSMAKLRAKTMEKMKEDVKKANAENKKKKAKK